MPFLSLALRSGTDAKRPGQSCREREREKGEKHTERNVSLFWRLFGCQMALFEMHFAASLRFILVSDVCWKNDNCRAVVFDVKQRN